MKKHLLRLSAVLAALGATLASSSAAAAGGPEALCDGTPWRWATGSGNPISWRIARDRGFPRRVVPGFPGLGCQSGGSGRPGVQSMVRAARQWTTANYPGIPVQPGVSNVSTFALSDPHTSFILQDTSIGQSLFGFPDGENVVTCLEPAATLALFGDPPAITATWLDATGTIVEGDIVINTTALDGAGNPFYVWIEDNTLTATSYITSTVSPSIPYYWDLQGVLTHQFGRFAGLASSMVEGEYVDSVSTQPTMFPFAVAQFYSGTASNHAGGSCTSTGTVGLSNVRLLGRDSRTLEYDDLAAIGTAYPKPAFSNYLGSISGIVQDAPALRENAGHFVAISASDPANVRIGGILFTDGTYTVQGLPPGDYHLLLESVESPRSILSGSLAAIPDPTATTWFFGPYFTDGSLPYLYQEAVGGAPWDPTSSPCIAASRDWRQFTPELFDPYEETNILGYNCEYSPTQSLLISVSGGQSSTADFSVANGNVPGVQQTGECCLPNCQGVEMPREKPLPLWVGIKGGGSGLLSARGLPYGAGSAAFTLALLAAGPMTDDPGASWAGGAVTLRLSTGLDATQRADGQVQLIDQSTSVSFNGTLDANSLATFDFGPGAFPPVGLPSNLTNIYAQVELFDPSFNQSMLSNVVVIAVQL